MQNWSKTLTFSSSEVAEPCSVDELQKLTLDTPSLKAIGTKHSFSEVADTDGTHASLAKFDQFIELNPERGVVSVGAGVRYGELGDYLHKRGYALHNLASLPHISVIGACATATHGSGNGNGNLGTAVRAMELVTARGSAEVFSKETHGEQFQGMIAHLGALGIVTKVDLEVMPTYSVAQTIYERLKLAELERNFNAITGSAYSVSLFTTWRDNLVDQVWLKDKLIPNYPPRRDVEFYGALAAQRKLHPIRELDSTPCTDQLGTPGAWHERLPHFRLSHTPSSGDEIQTEYFFSRHDAPEAIRRIFALGSEITPVLFISEIRTVAADEQWLSPAYKNDRVGIHFTWKPDREGVERVLPIIEAELADLNPIPHWAKVFRLDPEVVRSRYPRLKDFQELARDLDPRGKFRNNFLDRYVL